MRPHSVFECQDFTRPHSVCELCEKVSHSVLESLIQSLSSVRKSLRSYSVSYCFSSHNSPSPSITLCALCRVAVAVSVFVALCSLTENRSSTWSVAMDARLALSALITELAMFILNFCRLQTQRRVRGTLSVKGASLN